MIVKISKMREPTTQNAGTRKIEDPQEHCHKLESFAKLTFWCQNYFLNCFSIGIVELF